MWLPYRSLPNFKGLLFVLALIIIFGVMIYTNNIVEQMRDSSRKYLTLQADRFRLLFMQEDAVSLDAYLQEMASKDFPVIFSDSSGSHISWSGLPQLDRLPRDQALAKARHYQRKWVDLGNQPVPFVLEEFGLTYYFYYGDSEYIRRLRLMPWIELLLVGGLIFIGYFGFTSIKRSEERSVWVGMAKEAAHQLGTPLTSLMGWLELLEVKPHDPAVRREMSRDLERLKAVAERFNKIGSAGNFTLEPLSDIVHEVTEYIHRRLPQLGREEIKIVTEIPQGLTVRLNRTLFGWMLENLLKNSVEVLKGSGGMITVRAKQQGRKLYLDVSDNGSGIPRIHWRDIFRPGYSTKNRGWGLGLSLARRIIEEMHGGKIGVLESSPDKGTTIRVQLSAR